MVVHGFPFVLPLQAMAEFIPKAVLPLPSNTTGPSVEPLRSEAASVNMDRTSSNRPGQEEDLRQKNREFSPTRNKNDSDEITLGDDGADKQDPTDDALSTRHTQDQAFPVFNLFQRPTSAGRKPTDFQFGKAPVHSKSLYGDKFGSRGFCEPSRVPSSKNRGEHAKSSSLKAVHGAFVSASAEEDPYNTATRGVDPAVSPRGGNVSVANSQQCPPPERVGHQVQPARSADGVFDGLLGDNEAFEGDRNRSEYAQISGVPSEETPSLARLSMPRIQLAPPKDDTMSRNEVLQIRLGNDMRGAPKPSGGSDEPHQPTFGSKIAIDPSIVSQRSEESAAQDARREPANIDQPELTQTSIAEAPYNSRKLSAEARVSKRKLLTGFTQPVSGCFSPTLRQPRSNDVLRILQWTFQQEQHQAIKVVEDCAARQQNENERLREVVAAEGAKFASSLQENTRLNHELREVKQRLASCIQKLHGLSNFFEKAGRDFATLRTQGSKHMNGYAELIQEETLERRAREYLLLNLKTHVNDSARNRSSILRAWRDAEAHTRALQKELEDHKRVRGGQQAEIVHLKQQSSEQSTWFKDVKRQLQSFEDLHRDILSNETLNSELLEVRTSKAALEADCLAKDERIKILEEHFQESFSSIHDQVTLGATGIQQLNASFATHQIDATQLQNLETSNSQLSHQLQEAREELQAARDRTSTLSASELLLKIEMQQLRDDLHTAQEALESMKAAESRPDHPAGDAEELRKQTMRDAKKLHEETVADYDNRLFQERQKRTATEARYRTMQAEMLSINAQLDEAKSKLSEVLQQQQDPHAASKAVLSGQPSSILTSTHEMAESNQLEPDDLPVHLSTATGDQGQFEDMFQSLRNASAKDVPDKRAQRAPIPFSQFNIETDDTSSLSEVRSVSEPEDSSGDQTLVASHSANTLQTQQTVLRETSVKPRSNTASRMVPATPRNQDQVSNVVRNNSSPLKLGLPDTGTTSSPSSSAQLKKQKPNPLTVNRYASLGQQKQSGARNSPTSIPSSAKGSEKAWSRVPNALMTDLDHSGSSKNALKHSKDVAVLDTPIQSKKRAFPVDFNSSQSMPSPRRLRKTSSRAMHASTFAPAQHQKPFVTSRHGSVMREQVTEHSSDISGTNKEHSHTQLGISVASHTSHSALSGSQLSQALGTSSSKGSRKRRTTRAAYNKRFSQEF